MEEVRKIYSGKGTSFKFDRINRIVDNILPRE